MRHCRTCVASNQRLPCAKGAVSRRLTEGSSGYVVPRPLRHLLRKCHLPLRRGGFGKHRFRAPIGEKLAVILIVPHPTSLALGHLPPVEGFYGMRPGTGAFHARPA